MAAVEARSQFIFRRGPTAKRTDCLVSSPLFPERPYLSLQRSRSSGLDLAALPRYADASCNRQQSCCELCPARTRRAPMGNAGARHGLPGSPACSSALREIELECDADEVGQPLDPKLFHDARLVHLDRARADAELDRDLAIVAPCNHAREHLAFACREAVDEPRE